MSISFKIKEIIMNFIKKKYFDYLSENNILIIEESDLKGLITNFYNDNVNNLKSEIRSNLKQELKDEYPSLVIENALLDIFQDNTFNINRILLEVKNYQESICKTVSLNVYNKNLGIKINLDKYVEIVSAENPNNNDMEQDEIYNTINNYKYIYSINNIILLNKNKEELILIIKNLINSESILELIIIKDE